MGRDLLKYFPWTRTILEELDQVLQAQPEPPKWSLVAELTESRTAEHLRQPEFSQPLVTALQLCIVAILESWGVKPSSVVGHSSGEIAAAYTAGFLDRAGAIKAAFYRGRAAVNRKADLDADVGMLAIGLSAEDASPFLGKYVGSVWIACFNSPNALTISGKKFALEALAEDVKTAGHFARLLQVDLAYHSELMGPIGVEYDTLLNTDSTFKPLHGSSNIAMFSSVTASKKDSPANALYWKTNMVSPVRFAEALKELITKDLPDLLIEIGPSGALAGPVSQVLKALPHGGDVSYCASWSRGANAGKALFDVAGRLFVNGAPIDMSLVNEYNTKKVRTIIDLPNYSWNHSIQYWYENDASKEWRFKQFITHDLLGAKITSTSWEAPTWRKHLNLADVPWLGDHRAGPDVVIPGAGLSTFALEAMYQKHCALNPDEAVSSPNELAYRFRNVNFKRALVVEEGKTTTIMVTLSKVPGSKHWHEFRIRTKAAGVVYEHCFGLIRVQDPIGDEGAISGADLEPLRHPQNPKLWYKLQDEVGMSFGPAFQKLKSIESVSGSRKCRTILSLDPPPSKWDPQSYYPIHPAVFDTCIQTVTPANAGGDRSSLKDVMIPALIDDMIVNKMPKVLHEGLSVAESVYTGRGRKDVAKSWIANIGIHDPQSGALLVRITGLNYVRLDVDEKPDPHVFQAVTWRPDVSLLTQNQLNYLPPSHEAATKLDTVIDLVAHKHPTLKILEIDLDGRSTTSSWFQGCGVPTRAAYSRYDFATVDANTLVSVQMAYEIKKDSAFHLISLSKELLGLSITEPTYDLVIVKAPERTDINVEEVINKLKPMLKHDAFTLVVPLEPQTNGHFDVSELDSISPKISATPSEASSDSTSDQPPLSSLSWTPFEANPTENHLKAGIFDSVRAVATRLGSGPAYLYSNTTGVKLVDGPWHLTVARFDENTAALDPSLQSTLEASGWTITTAPIEKLAFSSNQEAKSLVLVVEELSKPVLTQISEEHWEALKQLVSTGKPLLWVTKGGQTSRVTNPDNAMVQGLFRVIRHEDPLANLTTLDVQSATSPAATWAIEQVLRKVQIDDPETEYAERDGVLFVPRVVLDLPINDFKAAEGGKGLELTIKGLHATKPQVRIQAEKIGTLQSLTWTETAVDEVPMEPGMVEIEVMTVGVNFKVLPPRIALH
jgi:malonyl CoA-acyl carrier protein transacylase